MTGPRPPSRPDDALPLGEEALEALLREQTLLPLPPGLAARLLAAVQPPPRLAPWALAGRVAAAVLVLLTAWIAAVGTTPAMADILPSDGVVAAVPTTLARAAGAPSVLMDVPMPPPSPSGSEGAGLWIALGALLLAVGLMLAWRSYRGGKDDLP